MPYYADRVKEFTTVTGTGSVSMGGAVSGFQTFLSAFPNIGLLSITVPYCIDNGAEWEVGFGSLFSGGVLMTRDRVVASSNAGSLVSFSAGTKVVYVTAPAAQLDNGNLGFQMAVNGGMAMP